MPIAQVGSWESELGIRAVWSGSKAQFLTRTWCCTSAAREVLSCTAWSQVFGAGQLLHECLLDERMSRALLKRHIMEPRVQKGWGGVLRICCHPASVLGASAPLSPLCRLSSME